MRLRIRLTGLVQGVGFRPFVYRLAREMGINGYVRNDTIGVLIDAAGEKGLLDEFLIRLEREKPSICRIYSLQYSFLDDGGKGITETVPDGFEILESSECSEMVANILPDIATCDKCLKEINDLADRRFYYPFTNCTDCGPRFTIIERLPYDRKNTSMSMFKMCPECEDEYNTPDNRRFHAQPNACHECGPHPALYDVKGMLISEKRSAIEDAIGFLRTGKIVAVKGIGGFHLLCDAENEDVVKRLRMRKCREEKPMAVMFPDIDMIRNETYVNRLEERAITSIERPIVIVRRRERTRVAESVSPCNSTIGVFLPYTPLHHLLLHGFGRPVVATSANRTSEPIVKDDKDAFERLLGIADLILIHNRQIVRRCDDSVVRIMAERQVPIRRSRGFAPLPVIIPFKIDKPVLALGGYMNNTIAIGIDNRVYISQHIGDLDTPLAREFFEETIEDMLKIFGITPDIVVSDLHPGYYSTIYGEQVFPQRLIKVQHHLSHILSCMVENGVSEDEEVIGFAFDGTGYGMDKNIWGGEVMVVSYREFKRPYHLKPYRLPGGEKAIEEPYRTAISLLYETFGEEIPEILPLEYGVVSFLLQMIKKGVNSPLTTSMGRLFDGIASIIGLRQRASYHAQSAIEIEELSLTSDIVDAYPFVIDGEEIDWRPMIKCIVADLCSGSDRGDIARRFHNTVVEIVIGISKRLCNQKDIKKIALSGGVFQNTVITEQVYHRLKEGGFIPLIHQGVPPNDGGISLGQVIGGRFRTCYSSQ